jgi:hypothetical protein
VKDSRVERDADDHRHGKVDEIAAEQELPEAAHEFLPDRLCGLATRQLTGDVTSASRAFAEM